MIPKNLAKILKMIKSQKKFPILPAPVLFGYHIYHNQHFILSKKHFQTLLLRNVWNVTSFSHFSFSVGSQLPLGHNPKNDIATSIPNPANNKYDSDPHGIPK
jgi:hypothetical protein